MATKGKGKARDPNAQLISKAQQLTTKSAKLIRGFLSQKAIKKCKKKKEEIAAKLGKPISDPEVDQHQSIIRQLEALNAIKNIPIPEVVERVLLETGFDPSQKVKASKAIDPKFEPLIQEIVNHQRMHQTKSDLRILKIEGPKIVGKRKRSDLNPIRDDSNFKNKDDGISPIFVGSLNDKLLSDEGKQHSKRARTVSDDHVSGHYGPTSIGDDEFAMIVKKNRPGQRARKAKALAQKGIVGFNWREQKTNPEVKNKKRKTANSSKDNTEKTKNSNVQNVNVKKNDKFSIKNNKETTNNINVNAANKSTDLAELHPSWAAKIAQKQKEAADIVSFSGKKVTFAESDDES